MENDVVIDRVHAATIRAPVIIESIKMNVVDDTGAECEEIIGIPADKRPHLRQAQTSLITTEAGRKMTVEVGMIMSDKEYVLDKSVAPIADDLLLGCDFFDEHDVQCNYQYQAWFRI